MDADKQCEPGTPLFYELPQELHPLILLHISDVESIGKAFQVCKLWSSFATDAFLRTLCVERLGFLEQFKPHNRDWKFVLMSKRPLGTDDVDIKVTGIGCRTLSYGLYEGEWVDSQRHGIGCFYWKDRENYDVAYVGEWKDDARTGHGDCYWNTNDCYSGEWLDDKAEGHGVFTWASGSKYIGGWKEGKQHGKGQFLWKHGDSYDGDWVEGRQTGRGIFQWAPSESNTDNTAKSEKGVVVGDSYDGEWVNNKKEGYGVFTWENGDKYEGEWVGDKKTGKGKFTWSNGDWYEGGWESNKKHGKGVYSWINGDKFEGEWIKGKQTGHGINTWANKNRFSGIWEDGEKREGEYFENASGRSFNVKTSTATLDITFMHPDLQEAVAQKRCTYSVTGQRCFFQYLWETKENIDRTHGVCVACHEHCVPKNGIKLMEPKRFHFGGNFWCDCGYGYLENPCTLGPHHQQMYQKPAKERH